MKAFSRLIPICTVIVICWQACTFGSNETNTEDQGAPDVPKEVKYIGARLVQIDSIMVDVLANLTVYDYHAEAGLFLAGDVQGAMRFLGGPKFNELGHIIFNESGEILHRFKRTDDGPEDHGARVYANMFMDSASVGLLSRSGFYFYNLDGDFIQKIKELNVSKIVAHSIYRKAFVNDAGKMAIGITLRDKDVESNFKTLKPMRFYDLNRVETGYEAGEELLMASHHYPDHMIFSPDRMFTQFRMPPRVAVNHVTNEAYALYNDIPNLEVYDMETGDFKRNIPLEPEHFGDYVEQEGSNGLGWYNTGGRLANSHYHDILQLGEYTLMRYSTALPKSIIRQLVASGQMSLGKVPEWPSIRRKHFKFYYQLFKDGKRVLPDFLLPTLESPKFHSTQDTFGKIIGGNGLDKIFVHVPNYGAEELDYELIRVYKLELTKEE